VHLVGILQVLGRGAKGCVDGKRSDADGNCRNRHNQGKGGLHIVVFDPESIRLQYYTSLQFIAQGKRGWPDSDSVILKGGCFGGAEHQGSAFEPAIFDFVNVFGF
jgi:hypothetical protein